MSQVKKISVAKVYGPIKLEKLVDMVNGIVNPRPPVHVMRVGGVATGTKTGTSDFGPWTALVGDFIAISGETGEEMRAPYCFMPDVALTPLTVALAQQGAQGVRFMIDIFAVYSSESQTKYEYTWEPVVKAQSEDAVALLLSQAAPFEVKGKDGNTVKVGGTLALEAPAPGANAEAQKAEPAVKAAAPIRVGKK